jgi:hypothetical protein
MANNFADTLNALAKFYRVDGDYMRCTACKRPQQVRWCHAAFPHVDGCRNERRATPHPWLVMRDVVVGASSALPPLTEIRRGVG